jgi:hypothetical protein
VTVGIQIENRVNYGFVTVRDLLLVHAIRGVRAIRILTSPLFYKSICIRENQDLVNITELHSVEAFEAFGFTLDD